MTERLTVIIADDHAPTRASVGEALAQGGFEVRGEAADAKGAVDLVVAHEPDVALLDVHMPGGGIAAASDICARLPDTAIVMLTVSRTDDDLFDALRAGARGYLLKDMSHARLADALRGVIHGEAALPRGLVSKLVQEFQGRERDRRRRADPNADNLSSREWEVLELMADGHGTADIAERLFVAKVTVRSHVSSILRKLRVADREAAVRYLKER